MGTLIEDILNIQLPRKKQDIQFLFLSLLFFFAFFFSFVTAQNSYQISFSAQEISGASSNLGFVFVDGVPYNLSCQLSMTEGYHSILYYPEDDYQFSEWDSDGLVIGSISENENIVHITRSGSIRALYKKGPELDVNIVHPKNNDEVNGSIVTLSVLISHLNTPIHNANVSFYINEIYIGYSLSDSQGMAFFDHPINPFIQYTFKASAKKREYVRGSSNSVVFKRVDEYSYSLMTNNEEDIFTSNFYVQAHFRINNVPAANVAFSFYLDGKYLGTTYSATNGWSTIRIDDIPFGNHSWYVIFSKENIFSVQSDLMSFFNYGEIKVEIFPSLPDNTNFNEDHIMKLNTKVLSNGHTIAGMSVQYFINNTLFGTKITNREGVSTFEYEFNDINERVVWYSNVIISNEVEKKSESLSINSVEYIEPLQITPIYPMSDTIIHPYTNNIQLSCEALINGAPVENVSMYFYVNDIYLGFNNTDESGVATFIFSPQLDGRTYEWFVVGSKKIHI